MSVYARTVKESTENVLERAMRYFGPGGLGLKPLDVGTDGAEFAGGGGHVSVTVCPKDGKTEVGLETREWDVQVRKFLAEL